MSQFLNYCKDFLTPPDFLNNKEKTRKAYLLHSVLWTLLLVMLFVTIGMMIGGNLPLPALMFSGIYALILAALQIPLRQGRIYLTAWILVVSSTLGVTSILVVSGTIRAPVIVYYIFICLVAGLVIGRKAAIGTSLTIALVVLSLIYAEINQLLPPPTLSVTIAQGITFITGLGLSIQLLNLATRSIDQALVQAQDELSKRQQIEAALRDSEERFRIISSVTSDYTFSSRLNLDGELEHILLTGAFEAISGYSPKEFLKIGGWQATLHPDDKAEDERAMAVLRQNKPAMSEVRIIKKNGDVRWVRVYAHPVWDTEENRLRGVNGGVQDITERRQAEESILNLNVELESKAKQLTTLNEIAHDISLVTDLNSTLKRVLAILQSILPIDAFFVALYDAESNVVSYPIMFDNGQFYDQESLVLANTSWASQVINSGQPMLLNRTPEEVQAINKQHRRIGDTSQVSASVIMTPLPIGNKNIGVISVQSYTFNIYNEKHMELLTGAGYQIAIAVENARLYDSLQSELAERKRLEDELQEYTNKLEILVDERTHGMRLAKEQVELILDNTSDALLFAEPNGDIVVTNPAFRDGFGQHDMRSIENIFAYIDDEEQIRLISSAMLNVIQHGQSQRVTVQVSPNHNGVKKDLDIALIPVRSSEEEPLSGILLSGRDITQQKEIERFKARFVADALHDLATPISGISMRTYLLERSPDQLKEHVQALQNQVQHLTSLLEDLRTLSRLDRAATELNIEKANINQLARLVFDTYEPVAMDKGQQLILRLEQSLPDIAIDQRQIERVLVNLVSNAVNYTGRNKNIVIETLHDSQFLIVNVIDKGMGIEAEDLPHVFERFYRTDKARQDKQSGTGLGLAISKEIVELHGGTVSAISKVGVGSTFTIRLPL